MYDTPQGEIYERKTKKEFEIVFNDVLKEPYEISGFSRINKRKTGVH